MNGCFDALKTLTESGKSDRIGGNRLARPKLYFGRPNPWSNLLECQATSLTKRLEPIGSISSAD